MDKEEENIASNDSLNTSTTNMSLPRPKTFPKEQIIQRESAINSSAWLQMAWNGFSSVMEAFIKWLYIGIEWPKDIKLRHVRAKDSYRSGSYLSSRRSKLVVFFQFYLADIAHLSKILLSCFFNYEDILNVFARDHTKFSALR